MRQLALLAVVLSSMLPAAHADGQSGTPVSARDSIFRRARRMVSEGNGMVGRQLVDSLLKREEEGTPAYGDALYWRGALAETAAEAERDYRRVIVEYPRSFYVDDALLAIAELEQARGDRAGALAHLQRFVREHPVSTARGVAALAAARLAFEQRDTRVGCQMIAEARLSAATTDVELRNQIDYFGNRCTNEQVATTGTTPATVAPVVPPATPSTAVRDTAPRTTVKPQTPPAAPVTRRAAPEPAPVAPGAPVRASQGSFTVQLAAYNSRVEAERMITKLAVRNVKARVSGTAKPFRVRLGFFETREAAAAEVASLKARGIIGFVTTETPASRPTPP